MSDKGMIFNGEMVSAILDGTKTQTRRIVRGWKENGFMEVEPDPAKCPYPVGSRIWVRETWNGNKEVGIAYRASNPELNGAPWRPSIHMPSWASRINLVVDDVRVQRLQEISEADAMAEGCDEPNGLFKPKNEVLSIGQIWFSQLWDSIYSNRGYGWSENPWVWAITFRRDA